MMLESCDIEKNSNKLLVLFNRIGQTTLFFTFISVCACMGVCNAVHVGVRVLTCSQITGPLNKA